MQAIVHMKMKAIANADASHSDRVWRSSFLNEPFFSTLEFDLTFSRFCWEPELTLLLIGFSAIIALSSVLSPCKLADETSTFDSSLRVDTRLLFLASGLSASTISAIIYSYHR